VGLELRSESPARRPAPPHRSNLRCEPSVSAAKTFRAVRRVSVSSRHDTHALGNLYNPIRPDRLYTRRNALRMVINRKPAQRTGKGPRTRIWGRTATTCTGETDCASLFLLAPTNRGRSFRRHELVQRGRTSRAATEEGLDLARGSHRDRKGHRPAFAARAARLYLCSAAFSRPPAIGVSQLLAAPGPEHGGLGQGACVFGH